MRRWDPNSSGVKCVREQKTKLPGVNKIWARKRTTKRMFQTISHRRRDSRSEPCRPAHRPTEDRVTLPNYIQLFIPQMTSKKRKRRAAEEEKGVRDGEKQEVEF